jgi:uncharacterized protein HemX
VPPKTGLLATVSVVALIGWGVAGYAFWSGSNELHATAAQLQQVEVARQDVANRLDELQKTAGTLAELQAKITDAQKQHADAPAGRTGGDQQHGGAQQSDDLEGAVAAIDSLLCAGRVAAGTGGRDRRAG